MNKKHFVFLFILLIIYISIASQAKAQGYSAGVYPPITKIHAISPVSLQSPIVISNTTDNIEEFKISFRPFTQSDDNNGQVRFLKSNELNLEDPLIFQRIKIFDGENEISSIKLAPKEQKKLSIHLDIPDGETASDYYFSILFTSMKPESSDEKNKSDIQTSIATNVLLAIGNTKPNVSISQFSTSFIKTKGPTDFVVEAKNNGKSYTDAHGYITIKDMFGHIVGRVELKHINILSQTSRLLASKGEIKTASWPEPFLLGPYTANLTLIIGNNEQIISKSMIFIGTPLKFIAIIFLILCLGFIIRRKLKRRSNG